MFIELSPVDEVYSILAEVVPEILDGKVEIVSLGREVGIKTKIVVRSLIDDNPIKYFVGSGGEKVNTLKKLLATEEEIDFIHWSSSPQELITRALYPLKPEEISSIIVDPVKAYSTVTVESKELIGIAVGSKGNNVRLAGNVTGYHIKIQSEDDVKVRNKDSLARQVIKENIPPITKGEIVIKNIAHLQGACTKIIVDSDKISNPERICATICESKKLAEKLGTKIEFIRWATDPKQQIINALNLPNAGEVTNIEIAEKRARVKVSTYQCRNEAVGRNGINIKLAQRLTKYRIDIIVD